MYLDKSKKKKMVKDKKDGLYLIEFTKNLVLLILCVRLIER